MKDAGMKLFCGRFLLIAGFSLPRAEAEPAADARTCAISRAALTSSSADDREHAARMLYDRCSRTFLTMDPGSAPALRQAVASGSGAAAILLLGNFRDADSIRALHSVPSSKPVKLHLWSAPVPAPLVATVALARVGEPGPLEMAVQRRSLAELEFLLDALGEIEQGAALTTLATNTLSDEREVTGGVPSGARPRRRVCDRAVDAFTARLKPSLDFPLTPTRRYPPEQLAQARTAILQLLPR
jgi:hypothetical protein